MPSASLSLWRVELDVGTESEAKLRAELAPNELARAEGFARAEARRRFVVARGTLRVLLGSLLEEHPRSLPIEAGASGKPYLAGDWRGLRFNVARSGDLAAICIAAGLEVGVDLEAIRPVPSAIEIAKRRFAAEEARYVEAAEEGDVDRRFLLCWTRKEALAKATGAGLILDLRSFTVPLASPSGVVSVADPGDEGGQRWLLLDVPMGSEHVAALALPASAVSDEVGTELEWARERADTQPDNCEEIDVRPLLKRQQ